MAGGNRCFRRKRSHRGRLGFCFRLPNWNRRLRGRGWWRRLFVLPDLGTKRGRVSWSGFWDWRRGLSGRFRWLWRDAPWLRRLFRCRWIGLRWRRGLEGVAVRTRVGRFFSRPTRSRFLRDRRRRFCSNTPWHGCGRVGEGVRCCWGRLGDF